MPSKLSLLEELEAIFLKTSAAAAPVAPEESDDVPADVDTILAATEKVLAVNRGLTDPDERDSMEFRKIHMPADLMAERISMDAGKVRRILMRRVAKARSLKPVGVGAFDPYIEGSLYGNPLCLPLEEMNPLHLVEQARRISAMGVGGLSSDDSISTEAQALHPSTFGFLSAIEGPECHSEDTEVFTMAGWKFWPSVKLSDYLACRSESGDLFFAQPERLIAELYSGDMVCADARMFHLCVTPNHILRVADHDVYSKTGSKIWRDIKAADFVQCRALRFDTGSGPWSGVRSDYFQLPEIDMLSNSQKSYGPIAIDLWAEFMGWYLSEVNAYIGVNKKTGFSNNVTYISQSDKVNPDCCKAITELLNKLPFNWHYSTTNCSFALPGKQLTIYLKQFGFALDKYIPDYLLTAPSSARAKLFNALLLGDGRMNKKHTNFTSGSKRLAEDFERLAISLGYTTNFRKYFDSRERVKAWSYEVSILKLRERVVARKPMTGIGGVFTTMPYTGRVYCAAVPGSMLLTRRGASSGIWSGNSNRIGVDTRLAIGARIGSDGRVYKKMKHVPSGKDKWVSAGDLHNSVVGLPD